MNAHFANAERKLQLKFLMFKQLFLTTILLLTKTFLFGQISKEDYQYMQQLLRQKFQTAPNQ